MTHKRFSNLKSDIDGALRPAAASLSFAWASILSICSLTGLGHNSRHSISIYEAPRDHLLQTNYTSVSCPVILMLSVAIVVKPRVISTRSASVYRALQS